uniref:Reverse transcriptase domain-containing protein n=3 Tax=Leptobrachium leishanense TaxID=445787 RepID=A0A8C5Q7A1_9ANUR
MDGAEGRRGGAFKERSLRFLTYNVKGLNIPEKRSKLLRELRALRSSIVFLQETHFRADAPPTLTSGLFPDGFFSNYAVTKSRGTAILFSRDVPFQLVDQQVDPEGRYLFLKGSISDTQYTFASIYLPNTNQHKCLARILKQLTSFTSGVLVLGGDFNVPLEPRLDTSRGMSSAPSSSLRHIRRSLDTLRLVDVWRAFHAGDRAYSFFSPVHASSSRIDYIFLQQHHLHLVLDVDIGTRTWSDHSPVWMDLTSPLCRPRERTWRLNVTLLDDPVLTAEFSAHLTRYVQDNLDTEDVPLATVWEAHKAVIRGHFISAATALKRARNSEIADLLSKIRRMESQTGTLDDPSFQEVTDLRRRLNEILDDRIRLDAAKARCHFALLENKPGRLLAIALRQRRRTAYIAKIRMKNGQCSSRPDVIMDEFVSYYQSLYRLDESEGLGPSPEELTRYLEPRIMTKISSAARESLTAPIRIEELSAALKALKNGRCPGPDGLPLEYYKCFSNILSPLLLRLFQELDGTKQLHSRTLMASIAVIPKAGKDHTDCKNYRPISLLNVDTKLLAKILAERLLPFVPGLIPPDQVGFVPGREAKDATSRVLNAITLAKRSGQEMLLFSADAEKAFDRVRWSYLFEVLRLMNIPDTYLHWVTALYHCPSARIRINGALSNEILIHNGTRQGCPLSPVLFALSLEPLLQSIRSNADISGIRGSKHHHVVSAYADDLLFMLTDVEKSLPAVLRTIAEFGEYSSFRINRDKSELLDINLHPKVTRRLKQRFPFTWCASKMRYLGIWLTSSHFRLFDYNYKPLLDSFKSDLDGWTAKFLSWLGRINVIKMNLLPRILYIFQTVPIPIPAGFFTALRSQILKFIWPKGRPRVQHGILCRPKARGGLALPDIKLYFFATQLARILDWSLTSEEKLWLDIEEKLMESPLWTLPWVRPRDSPDGRTQWSIPRETLRLWRRIRMSRSLSSAVSPLLPLQHNPGFLPGVCPALKHRFDLPDRITVHSFLGEGSIPPLTSADGSPPLTFLERFNYAQIKSFLKSLNAGYSLTRPLMPFENFYKLGIPLNRCISTLYRLLQDTTDDPPQFQSTWTELLGDSSSNESWSMTYTLAHRGSPTLKCAENAYKILSFWYWTPERIHRIHPSSDPSCWRCGASVGTFLHMWWECSRLVPFWEMVHDGVITITALELEFSAKTYLLLQFPTSIKTIRKSAALRLVFAARLLIPLYWKTATVPSRRLWVTEVERLRAIDRLVAVERGHVEAFCTTWVYWDEYKSNHMNPSTSDLPMIEVG